MNKAIHGKTLTNSSSIFIDILRCCAALVVVYNHAHYQWFPAQGKLFYRITYLAHSAVIVFFVLSGYVIAYTTTNKNRGAIKYVQTRLSRLCSVVTPALLITMLIEIIVWHFNPGLHRRYSRDSFTTRYIVSGLFLNEIWFFSSAPLFNIALWSLSFEFWYYIIFGSWHFRKPGWKSLFVALAVCLIAGPKILLMMPIWLFGYFAYKAPKPDFNVQYDWSFVFFSFFIAGLVIAFVPGYPFRYGFKPLFFANQFLTDWLIGLFIAIALWFLPSNNEEHVENKWALLIRKVANLTFPLYVLHFPLLILYRFVFGFRQNEAVQFWEAVCLVTVVAMLIGLLLDKQRILWDKFFGWMLNTIKDKI